MQKLSLTALALAAAFVAPAVAHADPIYQHATKCREAGGAESSSFNFSEYRVSRIAAGGSGILLCPVDIQDQTTVSVRVHTIDTMTTGALSCTVSTRDNGGSVIRFQTKETVGSASTPQSLTYSMPRDNAQSVVLSCLAPVNTTNTYTKLFGYVSL